MAGRDRERPSATVSVWAAQDEREGSLTIGQTTSSRTRTCALGEHRASPLNVEKQQLNPFEQLRVRYLGVLAVLLHPLVLGGRGSSGYSKCRPSSHTKNGSLPHESSATPRAVTLRNAKSPFCVRIQAVPPASGISMRIHVQRLAER